MIMEKYNIKEKNELIAKFMGDPEGAWYHKDWNMLMEVVQRIEEDHKFATMIYVNDWDNRGRYCFSVYRELDENGSLRNRFIEFACKSKIEAVWVGVLEFIWYFNAKRIPTTKEEFDKHYLGYRRRSEELQYDLTPTQSCKP